jgi:hypothetical protein
MQWFTMKERLMPALSFEQIKNTITTFVPNDYRDNPFVKALLAGAAAIGILLATPAFAPIGVVGATGWIIVYLVTGGTFTFDIAKKAWAAWRDMSDSRRKDIDDELARLKKARDDGALSEEEYRSRAQAALDKIVN